MAFGIACVLLAGSFGFIVGCMYGTSLVESGAKQLAQELYKCFDKDGQPFIDEPYKTNDFDDNDDDFLNDADFWKKK